MEAEESSVPKLLGDNIQRYRKKSELTQTELSEKIGVSQKHLSDIETGTKFPSAVLIEKISKELNATPAQLFGGNDSIEISNRVANLVMMNLQPKLMLIFNDIAELKRMMKNMKITIKTDDEPDFPHHLTKM